MSQIYVNGPAGLYIGAPSGAGQMSAPAYFLGYGRGGQAGGVDIDIDDGEEEVYTDLSGDKIPFDILMYAERATIKCDLTQFNEAVLTPILARLGGGTPGSYPALADGSLMLTEGKSFRLLIDTPFKVKPAFLTMAGPFNFFNAWVMGSVPRSIGNKQSVIRLAFGALPTRNLATLSSILFDNNANGIQPRN